MASISNFNNPCHSRSISLPSQSHPSMIRIEEELNKLKTWEASSTPTAEALFNGISGLENLYKFVDELLNLPLTQQVLSSNQRERWVNESLDISLILLDVCGCTRDFVSQIKEHIKDLQSALRRRKGDLSIESSIAKYSCFRQQMKKEAKKLIASLKQMDNKIGVLPLLELDPRGASLIRLLREVGSISISICHSLLCLFLSTSISKKSTRWSLVSKFIQKGRVACDDQQKNMKELESLDVALNVLSRQGSSHGDHMHGAQSSSEHLDAVVKLIENGLDDLFRRLVKSRASLLNILSPIM
ncbi:uncharacterized protein LOC127804326 [Diospyros lotus]|uniref:uncharacterized protein LOC127804326 n=1 Tax=Diospyros lotus TaxID=55363 RepID=UPI002258A406|nr:uncharacterized protein LOC127804326 [Diospyros lotus]